MLLRRGPLRARRRRSSREGAALVTVIVILAIASAVAAAALPAELVSEPGRRSARTDRELEAFGPAVRDFFRDTWQLPAQLGDLIVDPGTAGWRGPYVASDSLDVQTGLPELGLDGWSRAYDWAAVGTVVTVTSAGADGALGSADDRSAAIDVRSALVDRTARQVRTVNQAVATYNALYGGTTPLPSDLAGTLSSLVLSGLLPSEAPFEEDAWGDAFATCPGTGATVSVRSLNTSSGC